MRGLYIILLMTTFHCYHCDLSSDFVNVIKHSIDTHPTDVLKVRQKILDFNTGKIKLQSKNFQNIIPADLVKANKICIPDRETLTVKIQEISPQKACSSTSLSDVSDGPDASAEIFTSGTEVSNEFDDNDDDLLIKEINLLLPNIIETLRESGHVESWIKFNRLLSEKKLPMDNIAYLLFEDVVQWFSLNSTTEMRYREEVKQFWKIGQKLFHGKFLRFMSGLKHSGTLLTSSAEKGKYIPSESKINFAVPSRHHLENMQEPLKEKRGPGIFKDVICSLSETNDGNTYKLCVDGKKINAATCGQKYGDINLFGHEGPVTLKEKQERLSSEINEIETLKTDIENQEILNTGYKLNNLPSDCKSDWLEKLKALITCLSLRLKDLRQMKVGRTLGLNKFKSLAVGDWRKSKYVFVISAIQTALYQINDCIDNILHCLNNLGYFVSIINDASHLFSKENKVDLSKQQNYVCLMDCDDDIDIDIEELVAQAPLVKQRSQQWFLIRKEAKVTGSTANAALGLDTLKAQQTHYDKVFENVTSPEPTAEVKERMDYGTANEINALATLMSKCLPIYYPEVLYVEEGCHIIQHEGKPFVVVSPDGGGRSFVNDGRHSHLSSAILAIEAKCPFPDKKYTTQVTYKLPRYYVAQVMCEMKALGVSHLLFICYSKESSTLFLVSYDDILWDLMWEEFVTIYGKTAPQRPKRKSSKLTALADRIKYFIDQKVEFLCEIPSVEAIECGHGISTDSPSTKGHNVHIPTEAYTRPVDTVLLSDLLEQLAKCERWIKESHELCRTRASEVLVFLIADLNRFYKEEVPHSIPIAYGLKGYSLKVDCLRAMLFEILKLCKEQKLYTPVISFDGQWSKITVRAANGDPLTVLQLQKDVWNEACKMSKTAIQQYFFSLNILSEVHSLSDIKTKVDIDVEFEIGSRRNTLYVDCVKGPSKPFVMSKELNDELQNQKQNHNLASNLDEDEKRNDPNADASLLDSLGNSNNIVVDEDIIEQASSITLTQKETHSSNQFPLENHSDEVSDAGAKSNLENEMQMNPLLTDTQFHDMILNLQESKFREKWIGETKEGLFAKLSSKDKISKHFTKIEMQICLKSIKDTLKNEGITFSLSWSKCRLAEYFVVLMTDSDSLPRKSPKGVKLLTLKKLCQSKVRGWSKHMLNIAFAQHIFPQRFQMWRKSSIFRDNCFIHGLDTNIRWYSKPEYVPELDQHLFAILDSEHLLVNARAKVCSTGIKARGISREAWVKVARKSKINGTGLNLALVEDLVDKQKCAYALKTFSKEVESELSLNGDENEARFCHCLREWYSSEDDPGISAEQRCEKRLMFRQWLLQGIKFNNFPPPGQFVKDIPLIMFEGFLNNIDRRLQLFPMVTSGSYCVRALGSLECENLFGSFQDLDPSGSGVIKPDDIPLAMNTALEILRARMDPNRCFFMNTSKAKCYPVHDLIAKSDSVNVDEFKIPDFVDHILPRNHAFDLPERRKRNPKRKNSEISGPSMPSSGIKPVRQHHKCDESKILPSTRLGLDISEL